MPNKRVVITGIGIVAPNGTGIPDFLAALQKGQSGIRFLAELEALNFACQLGGQPEIAPNYLNNYLTAFEQKTIQASGIQYGLLAAMEAWEMAELPIAPKENHPDWDTGCIFGSGLAGAEVMRDATYLIDGKRVKRLGSTSVPQVMASGISAFLGGKLGLGNQVTSNASACSTGTESILMGYRHIQAGLAKRMLVGSCDSSGPYVWGGFDAMRVTNRKQNHEPEKASRPLSATANGFVPGAGAGAVMLESLESAVKRNVPILGEVLGGAINSGGHRQGGSLTAPNTKGILRCIDQAIQHSHITPDDIDAISGHLTATLFDPIEIKCWTEVLDREGQDFPFINAVKSLTGHCLSAAGAIESVACILQLQHQFLHPSVNCEDLHPNIQGKISASCVPQQIAQPEKLEIMAKSSFGFGDVNSCVIFKRFKN